MDLRKTANEYVEGIEKMNELFKKKFGELVFDDDIDTDVLDLIKSMFGMIDVSTRLVRDQANTIQDINEKLDKLLEIKEKES